MPRLLDHYLARIGYAAQQTDERVDPDRPDNLWEPRDAETDHGAHGRYGERARARSPQLWATTHRTWLLGAGAGVAGAVAAGAALLRRAR